MKTLQKTAEERDYICDLILDFIKEESGKSGRKEIIKFVKELKTPKGVCYACQYRERKNEIGDRKIYDDWMMGNTVMGGYCEKCKEYKFLQPPRDIDRAIRASNNEVVSCL